MNCQIITPNIFKFVNFTNKIGKSLNVSFEYVESAGKLCWENGSETYSKKGKILLLGGPSDINLCEQIIEKSVAGGTIKQAKD